MIRRGISAGGRSRPGQSSATWVICATAFNGLATYALLIVAARAVGNVHYADFSVFWAITIIVGLGVFLPLEQETARRVAALPPRNPVRAVWSGASSLAGRMGLGLAVLGGVAFWTTGGGPLEAGAFVAACGGYALQFPARGVLSGRRRLARYGAVTVVDAGTRLAAALILFFAGVHSASAYAAVVGGSALLTGLAALALSQALKSPAAGLAVHTFLKDGARLIAAAACMQGLLNSGTLIAKGLAGPGQAELAGRLLAVMTLARLPVFVFQSLQATYLTRLAAGAHSGDLVALRRQLRILAGLVSLVGVVIMLAAATVVPWLVPAVFGKGFEVTRTAAVLVALSVAVYMVASVANDVSIAIGGHRRIIVAWPAGVLVAAVSALLLSDLTVRSTVPLVLGAATAAAVLLPAIVRLLSPRRTGAVAGATNSGSKH